MTILAPRIMRGVTLVANDDINLAIVLETLSLPPLEETTETFQPGGADGEINIAGLGTKALVLGAKIKGNVPDLQRLFAGAPGTRHTWTAKQLVVNEEDGVEHEHAVDVLGRLTKIDPGSSQAGKPNAHDFEIGSIWSYTEYWDGQVLHRFNLKTGGWDVQNFTPVNQRRTRFLFS